MATSKIAITIEKKILMFVGDFVEDYEAMVPFQMLLMGLCRCGFSRTYNLQAANSYNE